MSFDRRTREEQTPGAGRAHDRRNRVAVIAVSAAVVAGLLGFGSYTLLKGPEADAAGEVSTAASRAGDAKQAEPEEAAAAGAVEGERSWDPEKLGRDHVTTPVTYPMRPPVGGDHDPAWLNCDGVVYEKAVPDVHAVHALEHGAVWVTYDDRATDADVRALASKVAGTPYTLMSPYDGQDGAIVLSAWGKQVAVDGADDPRVARFLARYVQGPQTPEPGAPCTGGVDG
ncbi:DUF3105 domain-containing protein [Streptomyces nitrosporeus]|uniref:DUF3105 domain-containing protein n=1 Tax=Streptomyces nitrosporeus TaxID=28894 RepID=A0A5J6FIM1_9ACTN|nr:DUF3105 domain-containing protein [Streptomyces nitrosporeus]QEU74785.1 DUF3105 domain-containing protein [Streptomyces nitrosporeus]GGY85773.1 membrane protein [Streptomyces nitrosporeus]